MGNSGAYECGGDGEDPNGKVPMDCPDVDLEVGGACGDVTRAGCCDGNGDVWFCMMGGDPNSMGELQTDDC
jgi:hypothetical protein